MISRNKKNPFKLIILSKTSKVDVVSNRSALISVNKALFELFRASVMAKDL